MTSAEEKEVRAFLVLNGLPAGSRRRAVQLLSEGKGAQEVLECLRSEGLQEGPSAAEGPSLDTEKEIELCAQKGIDFLLYSDAGYPGLLKETADPPLLLYMKGTLREDDRNAVAIVGTRHPSFYGRTQAKRFAQELAARGLTVVSGLARGIDQVAHDGALHVPYGRTIAVMGCGLDVVYPKEHEDLFRRIAERGAVLSEYPLGTPPLPENFPRRNRILSGLSYATFVVEAHSRSGSLITAHQAVEQGREVFALPGPVDQLTSRGTHQLIKEGACLVETPEEILLALADRLRLENRSGLADTERSLFTGSELSQEKEVVFAPNERADPAPSCDEHAVIEELLKEEGPLAQDEILEYTGLEASRLPVFLLRLELMKKIRKTEDGRYSLPC